MSEPRLCACGRPVNTGWADGTGDDHAECLICRTARDMADLRQQGQRAQRSHRQEPPRATEALCACGCGHTGRILCRGMLAACYQRVRRAGELPKRECVPSSGEDTEPYDICYTWKERDEPQPAIDPDILAIQRKRRQKGLCVSCGRLERKNGRPAALCARCRTTLAYCPSCEALYARPTYLRAGHSSAFCRRCKMLYKREMEGKRSLDVYLAERRVKRHAVLPELIRLYKHGQTRAQIAVALGLSKDRIDTLISNARRQGEWPKELRRRA